MGNKWTIGIIMLFLLGTVISGICEYTAFGETETNLLQRLMTTPDVTTTTDGISVFGFVGFAWDFLQDLWDVLWFNYSFWQGEWLMVKYILLYPISIAFILSIILSLRGVSSR